MVTQPASDIALIVAHDRKRCIGRNNTLPWRLPADLARFKQLTLGHPVIMGRKTWESIGRPLPGRLNLVLTRQADWQAAGAQGCKSWDEALELGRVQSTGTVWVIGGADLYAQALAMASRVETTEVDLEVEGGDAWFPELDPQEWQSTVLETLPATDSTPGCRFVRWERRSANPLRESLKDVAGLEFAALVGSRATGSAHASSDWDIAIRWSRDLSAIERLQRTEALRLRLATTLGITPDVIDLIDLATARLAMREQVATHGQVLIGEHGLPWLRFLQNTWAEVEEFHWRATHAV